MRGKDKSPRKREGYRLRWALFKVVRLKLEVKELKAEIKTLKRKHRKHLRYFKSVMFFYFGIPTYHIDQALRVEKRKIEERLKNENKAL